MYAEKLQRDEKRVGRSVEAYSAEVLVHGVWQVRVSVGPWSSILMNFLFYTFNFFHYIKKTSGKRRATQIVEFDVGGEKKIHCLQMNTDIVELWKHKILYEPEKLWNYLSIVARMENCFRYLKKLIKRQSHKTFSFLKILISQNYPLFSLISFLIWTKNSFQLWNSKWPVEKNNQLATKCDCVLKFSCLKLSSKFKWKKSTEKFDPLNELRLKLSMWEIFIQILHLWEVFLLREDNDGCSVSNIRFLHFDICVEVC